MSTSNTPSAAPRALGVDLGGRRIGVAVTAGDSGVVVPLITLTRERKQSDRIRRLTRLAREHGAETIVVGLPREMDGTEGDAAQNARAFAAVLQERSGLAVVLVDERLTSVEAEQAMRRAGASAERRKALIDQMAAVIILQSWLDQRGRA